jgi:archaemetzincin
MIVKLVPVGRVPESVFTSIKDDFENLNIETRLMNELPVPKEALNPWNKQYNARALIEILLNSSEVKFIEKSILTIMVTNVDIYYEKSSFVFGLEYPAKSCAIVSLARLRPEFYGERPSSFAVEERVGKEAVHEFGHHLGLDHCRNSRCVMSFSPTVFDIDKKDKDFCNECKLRMMTRGISLG